MMVHRNENAAAIAKWKQDDVKMKAVFIISI